MKKLLALATVAAAIPLIAVESANTVGYINKTIDSSSDVYNSCGVVFQMIGQNGTWQLKDVKAEGMDITADSIQFLSTDSAEVYLQATYADETYGAMSGWWDVEDLGGTLVDDETFDNGTAFLTSFASGNSITFTYAGEVPSQEVTLTIPANTTYPFVCNMLPIDVTLGDITASGIDITADSFQFLSTDAAETYLQVTYADDSYGALKGWWDVEDLGGTLCDDTSLPASQGMLGSLASGNEITLTFPNPLAYGGSN